MGRIENDKIRKAKNEHFIKAFEYVAKALKMSQGKLAEAIGSKSSYISNFKNGIRPVPDDTIERLISISRTKAGLQLFSEYLYGNSDIMLLTNVTDKEMTDAKMRRDNPDYDAVLAQREKHWEEMEKQIQPSIEYHVDPGSQMNATIAAQMQTIETLKASITRMEESYKRELKAKEDVIQSLNDQITIRDQLIADQKARLIEYRHIIDSRDGLDNYPWTIGAADGDKQQTKRK